MGIDFSKVTSIVTPNGNLSKIQRTNDNVVIWEKPEDWTYIIKEGNIIGTNNILFNVIACGKQIYNETSTLEYKYLIPALTQITDDFQATVRIQRAADYIEFFYGANTKYNTNEKSIAINITIDPPDSENEYIFSCDYSGTFKYGSNTSGTNRKLALSYLINAPSWNTETEWSTAAISTVTKDIERSTQEASGNFNVAAGAGESFYDGSAIGTSEFHMYLYAYIYNLKYRKVK